MNKFVKKVLGSFLDDCGFTQIESNRQNTYAYTLDSKLGTGEYTIYSVADRFLLNKYSMDFSTPFRTTVKSTDALGIGICSASRPTDWFNIALSTKNSLLAEISYAGNFNLNVHSGDFASSYGITINPDYYNSTLKPITKLKYEQFSEILNIVNIHHDIPELEFEVKSLMQLPYNSSHIDLMIESKLINIVSTILQFHERIDTNLTRDNVNPYDVSNMEFIRDYIRSNYMRSLSVDYLSKLACMSRSKFLCSFKHCYNITVAEYIKQLRISNSKDLLINTNESIKNIALAVGYKYQGSFSEVFKGSEKITPFEYRKRLRD